MIKQAPEIFLYTALPCEGRPIIDYFGLKKITHIHPFEVFSNERICLTVSGLGKSAMAAAVAYTQALFQPRNAILVNIGIAGGQNVPLGEIFLADKITDGDSLKNHYPPLIFRSPCKTVAVTTFSIPQTEYGHNGLYDMEASAFYEAAIHFTTAELAQTLKIISDNENSSIKNINPSRVSAWIRDGLPVLEQLLKGLTDLAESINVEEPENYSDILTRWHFSVSQQHKLKQLLLRYRTLTESTFAVQEMETIHSSSEFLRRLEKIIEEIALTSSC